MNNNDRTFVFLLGPGGVGQGHICELFERDHSGEVSVINFGKMVREMRKSCSEFEETYGRTIDAGRLLPDAVVCEMLNGALGPHLNRIVVVGGFNRTVEQADWSKQRGILVHKSKTVVLMAKRITCLRRNECSDDSQVDARGIDRHYALFPETLAQIMWLVSQLKGSVFHVDADRDIEKEVFPEVLRRVLPGTLSPAERERQTVPSWPRSATLSSH